jgi:polysulfide reductase chain B
MKQLGLAIDLKRCIGCKTCIVACRNFHELVNPSEAVPNQMPYYLHVESRWHGAYPSPALESWVVPCQHCPDPLCVPACPEGAIKKDPQTGIVRIDAELCNGCNAVPGQCGSEKTKSAPCAAVSSSQQPTPSSQRRPVAGAAKPPGGRRRNGPR